jgi:FkbM family methyltransferase
MTLLNKIVSELDGEIGSEGPVCIYGTGKVADVCADVLLAEMGLEVDCYLDSFHCGEYRGKPLVCLEDINKEKIGGRLILICSSYHPDIEENLKRKNIYSYKTIYYQLLLLLYCDLVGPNAREIDQLRLMQPQQFSWRYGVNLAFHIPGVLACFTNKRDRDLYQVLLDIRLGSKKDIGCLEDFLMENYSFHEIGQHYRLYGGNREVLTMLDCGASNNIFGYQACHWFKSLKNIIAFDPVPDLYKGSHYTEEIRKHVSFKEVEGGVWEHDASMDLVIDKDPTGISVIQTEGRSDQSTKAIRLYQIDSFLEKRDFVVDFIKMDIEGAELPALRGAQSVISSDRPILAVSIYHNLNDMVEIPLFLKNVLKNYSFRLGHHSINLNETVLYALPD